MNQYHRLRHGKNYEKVHIQICKLIALIYCIVLFIVLYAVYNTMNLHIRIYAGWSYFK
jgi:hypothetical protein